jgi:hypothetical protein
MPSEFKAKWEEFMENKVVDAFGDCFQENNEIIIKVIGTA